MTAQEIARRHFAAAIAEAETAGLGTDNVCRSLLGLVVSQYLAARAWMMFRRNFGSSPTIAIRTPISCSCGPSAADPKSLTAREREAASTCATDLRPPHKIRYEPGALRATTVRRQDYG